MNDSIFENETAFNGLQLTPKLQLSDHTGEVIPNKEKDEYEGLISFKEIPPKYKGEIFQVDKKTLEDEKLRGFNLLQEEKEEDPDKQIPQETKTHYPLPDNEKIDETKEFFEKVAATIEYGKLTPEEIVDRRSIAKNLLGITEEENTQWIENIPKVWEKEVELQQFLAKVILDEITKISLNEEKKGCESTKEDFLTEDVLSSHLEKCKECMKTIDLDDCAERTEFVKKTIEIGDDALWKL